MSEEAKVIAAENTSNMHVITAFNKIPYSLINKEIEGSAKDVLDELTEICEYYDIYKYGAKFSIEGTNGDYTPATLSYKIAASLVNKEARFMFAEKPDIHVVAKADAGKVTSQSKEILVTYNDVVNTILRANNFESALIKSAKDCFVGKRVACLVNFNEDDGVSITFLPSTQFIYETHPHNPNVITKFVCFIIQKNSRNLSNKRVFKKKYALEDDGTVYLEEQLYDGAGKQIGDDITPYQPILLDRIPAVVILNDGLTGDENGESEIDLLQHFESWYSKLANGDIDAERKGMNPVAFTVDMDSRSTKGLSRSAGSFWDLMSDQALDNKSPQVGVLESNMSYSSSLMSTLDRIKTSSYDQVDVPNINMETMVGSITSGKALKAIYWPLIVRCKEKMKTWGPQIKNIIEIIIEGSKVYPNCITRYTNVPLQPVDYTVEVTQNIPIQEDEAEEKQLDLAEVESKTMSRKRYMTKWYNMSDVEIQQELAQIALERQILEDAAFPTPGEDPYSSGTGQTGQDGMQDEAVVEDEQQIEEEVVQEEQEDIVQ